MSCIGTHFSDIREKTIFPKIKICDRLWISSYSEGLRDCEGSLGHHQHFFQVENSSMEKYGSRPTHISKIIGFIHRLDDVLHSRSNVEVVVCAMDSQDPLLMTNTALQLGAYLILCRRMSVDQVVSIFMPLLDHLSSYDDLCPNNCPTVLTCWQALCKMRCAGLLDVIGYADVDDVTPEEEGLSLVDVDEYLHYAEPANGNLHIILPHKILFFPTPVDLPTGHHWMDEAASRHFSPAFFAELFASINISLVLCLTECDYDRAAFTCRGIGVEELCLTNDGQNSLHVLDRLSS